jgi:hypothetical protein
VKRNKKCFKEDILSGFMCFWFEGKKMEGKKIMVINGMFGLRESGRMDC